MKFLIDDALSPVVAGRLRAAGHEAAHVRDHGLQGATDPEVLDRAGRQDRVVVPADTDFGASWTRAPSVVLFRGGVARRPEQQAALVLANLASIARDLEAGVIVVIEPTRMRVRALPIVP